MDVFMTGSSLTIPWELFTEADHKLFLNFHGALPDGSIVLRTNIASLGAILPSRTPSGEESESPSPSLVAQIQAVAAEALSIAQSVRSDADIGVCLSSPRARHTCMSSGFAILAVQHADRSLRLVQEYPKAGTRS